ncbi:Creatinase/aminopeptidase [Phlegmacium glaucopus]|nr:Creatinase/aminopeptidase [Phlegmacium glaucopus]
MQSLSQPIKSTPVAQHLLYSGRYTRLVCGIVFLLIWLLSRSLVKNLRQHSDYQSHCAGITPIPSLEYHTRQINLAKTLHALNASAYITEPSANSQFFANFSTTQWFLSERPLLFILTPYFDPIHGDVEANIIILTPKFEATRAKTLPLPNNASEITYVEWAEDEDPYSRAISVLPNQGSRTIFVDNSIRKFIADGLQHADSNANIYSAPLEITQMRERKSKAELEILRCGHEATLLAIREVHKKLYLGIRESEAQRMMTAALSSAGLQDGECLTLFGDNAALPHGSGTDKSLGKADFALFDCVASLHGYHSDVTRTVALPDSEIPQENLHIWGKVHTAQSAALNAAKDGTITSVVDAVARSSMQGYAQYFTHRLGHGIGLEVHEQPYLRGGTDDVIRTGHTFSDEPGIYIEGKVGVRLEDCFYIAEDGIGVYLTQNVGGQAESPWQP